MKNLFYLLSVVVCIVLSACGGDDEPKSKFSDATISYGRTYSIPNGKNISWKSSNDLVASVSGNVVTAQRVGEAIISSEKGSFKVTVTPTSYVFTEPCLKWGSTKSSVKSYMSNNVGAMTISEDSSTTLTYTGSGKASLYTYLFENSKLETSGIGLNGDYIDNNALTQFMIERYIPVKVDESTYSFYFISPDEETIVLMQLRTSGRTIVYLIVYTGRDSSRSELDFESLFDEYKPTQSEIVTEAFHQIQNSL